MPSPIHSQDLIGNSPYYPPYDFHDESSENLVLAQPIPQLIFFFILITCLLDIVLMIVRKILLGSLMGVKGLTQNCLAEAEGKTFQKVSKFFLKPIG